MDSLVKLFCDLVAIPSPSGKEAAVAAHVTHALGDMGIQWEADTAGQHNDSDCGNIIARLPGNLDLPTILFVAHLDTVETGETAIVPHIKDGIITSDGSTILGADDKMAVACLLDMLQSLKNWPHRPSVVVAFTTREEAGMMGSSLLNLPDKIAMAFNVDGPNKLGDFAYQCLGEIPFELTIRGKAAHAAIEPEKGANALVAAGHVLSTLPIGKSADDVVINIGTLQGGTANNVVPDKAVLRGQVRAYTDDGLQAALAQVETAAKEACAKTSCTYDFVTKPHEGGPPAALPTDHPMVAVAQKATQAAGLEFGFIKLSGTSDANFLAATYPTLTVCRGSKHPHAHSESVGVDEIAGLKRLLLALVAQVADTK